MANNRVRIGIKGDVVRIETEGFQGPACLKDSNALVNKLKEFGVNVNNDDIQHTTEFNATKTSEKVST